MKCTHLDLSLFEEAYKASKQARTTQRPRTNPSSRKLPLDPYRQRDDLRGIGEYGSTQITPGQLDAHDELADMLKQAQQQPIATTTASAPSPIYQFSRFDNNSIDQALLSAQATTSMLPPSPAMSEVYTPVPVGRYNSVARRWECKGLVGASEYFLTGVDNNSGECNTQHKTLQDLTTHYHQSHSILYKAQRCLRCPHCGMNWVYLNTPCPQCKITPCWEDWLYGDVSSVSPVSPVATTATLSPSYLHSAYPSFSQQHWNISGT